MRVLVTGATSMLGAGVARALADRGDEVTVFQRGQFQRDNAGSDVLHLQGDITRSADVAAACRGQQAVVHLAAKVSVTGGWEAFERVNVGGTRSLLREAQRRGVERFVHVSSPSVAHAGEPLVCAQTEPANPETARGNYARSKALAEVSALAANTPEFAVVAIRPHLVWGPGDTQLVGRIVERARGGRLVLVGGGHALIDSTYVDNAVAALVAALDRAPVVGGQAHVVTNGEPRTVAELLTRICRAAGVAPPTRSVPPPAAMAGGALVQGAWSMLGRDDEPPLTRFLAEQLATAHWFDQRGTCSALEWQPHVTLAEGFQRLANSFGRHSSTTEGDVGVA